MRRLRALGIALLATTCALGGAWPVVAKTTPETIAVADLPKEAREVLGKIETGGPFRYSRDGIVFGNREHRLPSKPRGYYHEYTVYTPGSHDRGARRVICGGPKTKPDACWYTADHYNSFRRIVQ